MAALHRRQALKGSVAWAWGITGWAVAVQAQAQAQKPAAPKPLSVPPTEVANQLPEAVLLGTGRLTFFGLHVYDARLWAPANFTAANFDAQPLALELQYARAVKGQVIAESSLAEMRKLAQVPDALADTWLGQMSSLFPDVNKGDRLTGVQRPGEATRLFFNGQSRGEVKDAEFTKAFFSIWLSPRTPKPALRTALLGAKAPL
jgi:hypothetical protein